MQAFSFKRTESGPIHLLPPDENRARPAETRLRSRQDAVDAEFVVLPRPADRSSNDNRPAPKQAAPSRFEPLMARLASGFAGAELALERASRASFIGLVLSLVILVFGLVGGFSFLSEGRTPHSSLSFSHVTVTPQRQGGMNLLQVNGIVENSGTATQAMRSIRADLIAEGRMMASIVIDPPTDVVYAGRSHGFSASLRYPGGEVPMVKLSFLD